MSSQDNHIRKCLRIYSVLRSDSSTDLLRLQAQKIHHALRDTDRLLRAKYGFSWRDRWEQSLGFSVKKGISKDWLLGRASIPILALQKLESFGIQTCFLDEWEGMYVSTTTKPPVWIPTKICPDLLYLIGLVQGDGSLPIKYSKKQQNNVFSILVISSNKHFLEHNIAPLFLRIFEIKKYAIQKDPRCNAFTLVIHSKPIYRFFSSVIGLWAGKKAQNASIPLTVRTLEPSAAIPFIAGLIDSDIGKHSGGLGATFRSKQFVEDLIQLFGRIGITAKTYGTHFKDKKYPQNDFTISKSQVKKLKDLLWQNYMPKRLDRLESIELLAGVR